MEQNIVNVLPCIFGGSLSSAIPTTSSSVIVVRIVVSVRGAIVIVIAVIPSSTLSSIHLVVSVWNLPH